MLGLWRFDGNRRKLRPWAARSLNPSLNSALFFAKSRLVHCKLLVCSLNNPVTEEISRSIGPRSGSPLKRLPPADGANS